MSATTPTIYMDHAATTPVDPQVVAAMNACLGQDGLFANPASVVHAPGRAAAAQVEVARAQVASLIGAGPEDIVWTSGATESDNLAITGTARALRGRGRHIVTARTEHRAVLDTCRALQAEGFVVSWLGTDSDGLVDPDEVVEALREDTILVSIMHANNEIGVLQDVAAIGAACRDRGVVFHVDAAQSAGKVPVDLDALAVDLMSLSAHKLYGPKGVGALFVGARAPAVQPLVHGGGHERGLRAGTIATHQVTGMGEACAIAQTRMAADAVHLGRLGARLTEGLRDIGGVTFNGHPRRRLPGFVNASFEGVEGESLLLALDGLAVASGSACSSASAEASYVLRALGRSDWLAQSSLRFSPGRSTTAAEVDAAVAIVRRAVRHLRALAPT